MKNITVVKMARLEIFAVGFILAAALNFVVCSNDEIHSGIDVSIVPNMAKYLMENQNLKFQPLIRDTKVNGVSPYATLTYRLGRRVAGKISNESGLQTSDKFMNIFILIIPNKNSIFPCREK